MSGNIHGISWFPNFPDKFVSWGQEINLYEVRNKDDVGVQQQQQQQHQQKSRLPYIPVNFLSNETRYQYSRCVAASYHSDQPIIAVGLADGKIGICNFRDTYDSSWEYSKPHPPASTPTLGQRFSFTSYISCSSTSAAHVHLPGMERDGRQHFGHWSRPTSFGFLHNHMGYRPWTAQRNCEFLWPGRGRQFSVLGS